MCWGLPTMAGRGFHLRSAVRWSARRRIAAPLCFGRHMVAAATRRPSLVLHGVSANDVKPSHDDAELSRNDLKPRHHRQDGFTAS